MIAGRFLLFFPSMMFKSICRGVPFRFIEEEAVN